jgi:Exostosin family
MNIYSDRAFVPETIPHAPLLYPFWGFQPAYGYGTLGRRSYEHYIENGRELFELSALRDARFAVLPFHWEQVVKYDIRHAGRDFGADPEAPALAVRRAEEFTALAACEGKPSAVFFCHDSVEAVPLGGCTVFRTSMLASERRPNEHAMPFWMPDEFGAASGSGPPPREKSARPVVGFCGHNPLRRDARAGLRRRLSAVPGLWRAASRVGVCLTAAEHPFRTRAEALDAASRSRELQTNFIFRDAWFNGAFKGGRFDGALMERSRRQYVENMLASDYVLCTRGGGNYSIRFYETLSSGRIPVFVNTDCVLPFGEWIDWKQYCVWVEGHEVSRVAERIAEFHESLSPAEFKDRQRACRRLWEEWLSPYGFYKNMRRHFD